MIFVSSGAKLGTVKNVGRVDGRAFATMSSEGGMVGKHRDVGLPKARCRQRGLGA